MGLETGSVSGKPKGKILEDFDRNGNCLRELVDKMDNLQERLSIVLASISEPVAEDEKPFTGCAMEEMLLDQLKIIETVKHRIEDTMVRLRI